MAAASLVWFRDDLRLADNPALQAAVQRGRPVVPVYIWAPHEEGDWPPGAASRWWLHQSLEALTEDLRRLGSRLIIRNGDSAQELRSVARHAGADGVFFNRRYEPAVTKRDQAVERALREAGLEIREFSSRLFFEPGELLNKSNKPFRVFSAFWRAAIARFAPQQPIPAPQRLKKPATWPPSVPLGKLELEPTIDWAQGLRAMWMPGERGAMRAFRSFCGAATQYGVSRNRPGVKGTSRLSPHLHFGEISPRQVWHVLRLHAKKAGFAERVLRSSTYVTELGWREFAYYLLHHFPRTASEPLRAEFERFPWRPNREFLKAWQRGRTGYPIVDAGMRELWATGWMHNRVRMIVASFLVKDLLQPWQEGARWFWDTLVDADLANNTLGWQWTSGCGADAAPFFRIFNPVLQGEKFDAQGDYVRQWVPELAKLPRRWIHQPCNAPKNILALAGVDLGKTYPEPIVSHISAREAALSAFRRIRG